ncbi:response regulator transcription factor [Actinomycetes bacterium KLBMP 9759]
MPDTAHLIRTVIVDDQALVRAGLARILGPEDGFTVVAEFADGAELLAGLPDADLVLMDVRMPRMSGIDATRALQSRADPPPVLILTTFDEDDVLWGAIEAGAAGFVLKDVSAADLIGAARAVAGGGAWFDSAVTGRVLQAYRRAAPGRRTGGRLDRLTDRELDVLRRMARGATNTEIAQALHVSEATVKTHVRSIFTKLGARDRAAAIVFAFDHGVVPAGGLPPGGGAGFSPSG